MINFSRDINEIVVVCGPSRGGKSKWAEYLLKKHTNVTYVATSEHIPNDTAWENRIKAHVARRPSHWHLIESGKNISNKISNIDPNHAILIDSIGGYVTTNIDISDVEWQLKINSLVDVLKKHPNIVIIVVEEVSWSVVPSSKIGMRFRERVGIVSEMINAEASTIWLVVQGKAINLSDIGESVND